MSRASTDVRDVEEIQRRELPFRFKNSVAPPGSTVHLCGNFEAVFDSGNPEDVVKGWDMEHEMACGPDGVYTVSIPDLQVGRTYEYKYRIVKPDGTEAWLPAGGQETNKKVAVNAPPPTPGGGSGGGRTPPPGPGDAVRATVKTRIKDILASSRTFEGAQGLHVLFEEFEDEMRGYRGVREDLTAMICEVVAEVIREARNVPQALKDEFPKESPVADLADLQSRIVKASQQYRTEVFKHLRADKGAQRQFRLKPSSRYNPRHPLGTPELDAMFDRLCSQRDLGHLAPHLEHLMDGIAQPLPATEAERDRLRSDREILLTPVWDRLTPEQRRLLAAAPSDRVGNILDTVLKGGLLVTADSVLTGGLGLAAVGLSEAALGAGIKDVAAAMKKDPTGRRDWDSLLRMMRDNNVLARVWGARKGQGGKEFKSVIKEGLKRAIPFSAFFMKPRGPEGAEGEEETGDPEEIMQDACEKALR